MYLAAILVISLVVVALRRGVLTRYAWGLAGLLVLQILVGALNVWLDEYEAMIVLHLALGTLLWATLVGLTLQLFRVRAPVPAPAGTSRAEALTA
jgi:heme A synthase